MIIKPLRVIVTFVLFHPIVLYCKEADSVVLKGCSTFDIPVKGSSLQHPQRSDPNSLDSVPFNIHGTNHMQTGRSNKNRLSNAPYPKFIIPSAFILYGVAARNSGTLQLLDKHTHRQVDRCLKVRMRVDDYLQYTPAISVYGLRLAGVKSSHNLRDQTIAMARSYIITATVVRSSKRILNVWRPDGSNNKSFPSGHTATAFVGAHLLFREYKDVSSWIGISGYAVSTSTGVLRVLNKKHWVSDVIAGAGVGILSVELAYLMLPVFQQTLGLKDTDRKVAVTPIIANNTCTIAMTYSF